MAKYDYTAIARQYAKDVVAGKILTCKWVQRACERQLSDLNRFKGKDSPYRFNPKLTTKDGRAFHPADNLCAFIERLPHVKGPLAGETIKLEPWQVFILTTVFGWVKPDGNRRFRRSYIEVPRGNAKSTLSSALALYMLAADGEGASDAAKFQIQTDRVLRDTRRQTSAAISGGGIAVIPIYGVITQRGNMVDDVSGPGMVSTQLVTQMLRQAVADDAVSQILLDIDSPGGSVYGVSELGDAILSARSQKPVVAIANSLAASAAYWVGSQASEFYVTAGGEVGSIGVWQAHFDYSQALAAEGVTPTLISAGKFKVEGNPYAPLSEEAQGFMQSRVDDYFLAFTKAIAKGRNLPIAQVRDGMGQGRVLGADAALAQSMVDGIASFDQVLSKMQKDATSNAKLSAKLSAQASLSSKPKTPRLAQARSELGIL